MSITTPDGRDDSLKASGEDRRTIAGVRARDRATIDSLVRSHHDLFVRVARRLVSSEAVAEEVAQDSWVSILQGIDRFEGRSSLRTWMMRILTNTAKARSIREQRSIPFSSIGPAHDNDGRGPLEPALAGTTRPIDQPCGGIQAGRDPEARAISTERCTAIVRHLGALPRAQRDVLALRDIGGWSSTDVCDALEISPGNQRVLLHRARGALGADLAAA
jgi:RNA polymerase sigma-70 factor (ECF subfamily)